VGGDEMEEKMIKLLTEMNQEMKGFRKDLNSLKDDMDQRFDGMNDRFDGIDQRLDHMDHRFDGMDHRFDRVESKLDGIGHQFELTNESRLQDVDFITTKVNKLEKEIFILKGKNNI
jgi:archaellum component FlaC